MWVFVVGRVGEREKGREGQREREKRVGVGVVVVVVCRGVCVKANESSKGMKERSEGLLMFAADEK